ncbi:MAG: ferritin family protein [Desulfomonilia bacterium]|nr:ferritin family protein [Desulfomonilia bacterium]
MSVQPNSTFNANEVFEMAINIERQGEQFYLKAADLFEEPAVQKLLRGLAHMEVDHQRTFVAMRDELLKDESYAQGFDPDGLTASYLHAMTSGVVFDTETEPVSRLSSGVGLKDVLNMGIEAEKNSIVFYTGIKGIVPDSLGKDKVDRIIEEEMKHVVLLSDAIASIAGD